MSMETPGAPRKKPYREYIEEAKAGEKVGAGAERTVYADPRHPGRVVTVGKPEDEPSLEDRVEFVREFILLQILHMLYPRQIPDAHLVSSRARLTTRERVEGKHLSRIGHFLAHFSETFQALGEPGRQEFASELLNYGLNIDLWPRNFMRTEGGDLAYLDRIYIQNPLYTADQLEEKARAEFAEGDPRRDRALHLIARFRKLGTREFRTSRGTS